jgi:hypothetical protein
MLKNNKEKTAIICHLKPFNCENYKDDNLCELNETNCTHASINNELIDNDNKLPSYKLNYIRHRNQLDKLHDDTKLIHQHHLQVSFKDVLLIISIIINIICLSILFI